MAPAVWLLRGGCAAVAVSVAAGRRAEVQSHSASHLDSEDGLDPRKLFAASDLTICGGTDIRRFLTAPKTADEIRNIPWSEVDAVADEFIRSQSSEIQALTLQLKQLQEQIAAREKAEAPKPITVDQVTALVSAAVVADGAYGTLAQAKSSKCGAALVRPRPPKTAYAAAKDAFTSRIQGLLKDGKTSARSQSFADTCYTVLEAKAGELTSNCDELCLDFAAAAQSASDAAVAALAVNGQSADTLRRTADEKAALLRRAQADLESCQQTKLDMSVFKAQLLGLTEDVKDKHSKLMNARDALMDAQYELMDAEDAVGAQEEETKKANQLLAAAGAAADAALAKLQNADKEAAASRSLMNSTQQELSNSQARLKSAQDTTDVVAQLKAAVTDSMLKMILYFEEAVRKPLRLLGFGECATIDRLFTDSLTGLESAKATRASMEALNTFCNRRETRTALAAGVSGSVDPRELCSIGDVPAIEKEIDASVAQSVATLREHLAQVQSWLDPFQGQKAGDRAALKASADAGELVGLREVMATFGSTIYYRQYLQNWQLRGKFQDILRALAEALRKVQEDQVRAKDRLDAAKAQLARSEAAYQAAAAEMQKALEAKAFAEGQSAEAEKLLASLNAKADTMRKNVAALEAAVAAAERRYEEAKVVLQATHKDAVSLVQLLEELEAQDAAQRVNAQ